MISFSSHSGVVTAIRDAEFENFRDAGCHRIMSVGEENPVNFDVSPETFFADQEIVKVGDVVTGIYNGSTPAILIYPPQYSALAIVKRKQGRNMKVDTFNRQLISSDGQLRLNIAPHTQILLRNGQPFTGNPAHRNLLVFYGLSTRNIPAQTTPEKIIVWC